MGRPTPARDAEALRLQTGGANYRQIGAALGVQPGSVSNMVARARAGAGTVRSVPASGAQRTEADHAALVGYLGGLTFGELAAYCTGVLSGYGAHRPADIADAVTQTAALPDAA